MNSSIRKLFYASVVLFAALLGMLAYQQVINARSLADNPHNTRKVFEQMRINRGVILASDNTELAKNRLQGGLYYRQYPLGDLFSQVVGYNDMVYGQTGLEHSQNDYLTGTADEVEVTNFINQLTGKQRAGANIKLTVDPKVQKTAMTDLQNNGKPGAVVVLDVHTGAVLAMASNPSYDPNQLEADWAQLNQDPSGPLLNRATQSLYTPGSSFKLITMAAALETGAFTPGSQFNDEKGYIDIDGNRINNYRATATAAPEIFGQHTLSDAFAHSINTTFAQVGDKVGQAKLVEYQQKFGLYQAPPIDLPGDEVAVSGRYVNGHLASPNDSLDQVHVAWMAIGQENVQVTPLQMAMVAQAIGNGGSEMKPYLVDSVIDSNSTVIRKTQPEQWRQAIQPQTASTITAMMVRVVNEGTGFGARSDKVQIAGKTGTAEVGGGKINAWFVGFAPADNPKVAIAVVVENAASTGHDSSPIARDVVLSALGMR